MAYKHTTLTTLGGTNKKEVELTNRKPISTVVRLLGALLLAAMALRSAPAFAGNVCSNADLQGAYVYSVGFTAINFPPNGPGAIMGKITLDGRGNFAGTVNGSVAGVISLVDVPITGTYSIAVDCTGSWTTIYPGLTAQFSLVLVDDIDGRKHAEFIGNGADAVATGTVKPMFAPAQNSQGN
jgi:hypothetical protein